MEDVVLEISLDIVEGVPAAVAAGMTSACLIVLAAGVIVGAFKTLLNLMGR